MKSSNNQPSPPNIIHITPHGRFAKYKWPILALVCVITILLASGAIYSVLKNSRQNKQMTENEALSAATDAVSLGDCDSAISALKPKLEKSFEDKTVEADARILVGQCYVLQKDYGNAESQLTKSKQLYEQVGQSAKGAQIDTLLQRVKSELEIQKGGNSTPANQNNGTTYEQAL